MNNKTSDKNVRNIEKDIERCEQLTKPEHANWIGISNQLAISHILAELEQMLKEREKYTIHLTDEEYRKVIANAQKDVANDSVIAHKFAVMQQQIDEKDKRIQELEDKLQDINTYILINGIDKPLRTATQIQVENQHEYIIQQKINELEKERDHWHGCFIVAMENSIAKEKVINVIQEYKYKIERYDEYRIQGKETDVEYYENIANTIIVQVLQELLEGGRK